MLRTLTEKDGRISIIGLTAAEYDILNECLIRCQMAMGWNEEEGHAEDGGDFLWCIKDRQEYDVLQNLII